MKWYHGWLIALCLTLVFQRTSAAERGLTHTANSPHAVFAAVDIDDVVWTEGFWADRFQLCREVMLDTMWELYMARAFDNLRYAAGLAEGEYQGTWWHDGDFYKWLEATAWVYGVTKDPALDRRMDDIIEVIGKAQEEDGYIDTPIQLGRGRLVSGFSRSSPLPKMERWTQGRPHEVYNLGHLITAACVHYRATGKRTFLNIAVRAADQLDTVFSVSRPELDLLNYNPSHIMALVELYRTVGDRKYLTLAQTILDMRGMNREGTDHHQGRVPFRQAEEATGHAVLGTYLYCGAADIYLETGEAALRDTLVRLASDVTGKRMYITGGCAGVHHGESQQDRDHVHEAFGWDYDLPSASAYNETCSSIGHAMWNWRMLVATGDAQYADVMERVWYNSLLSAINLAGTRFFYTNVLRWHGDDHTLLSNDANERWGAERGGICCPPNIVRTIAEMNGYAYGVSTDAVWVHLYGASRLNTRMSDGSRLELEQRTSYPWDGAVTITVAQAPTRRLTLKLRVPGWVENATVSVNQQTAAAVRPQSYFEVTRSWKAGDTVALNLPMPVVLAQGHPNIEQTRNQVAVTRGPIVYCLESTDLPPDIRVPDVAIPARHDLRARYATELLGGVCVVEGTAKALAAGDWKGRLYAPLAPTLQDMRVRLIPYYAWCNRGPCSMTVWIPVVLQN